MIWNIKWNNNYKTFSSLVKSLVRTGKYHCSLIISGSLPLPWFCCCLVAKLCPAAAAAAAKLLQSCPTLCDPIDGGPPGSPVPGILQARTLEWVAISFSNAWKWKVKVKSLSRAWLLATPWTAAHQAPSSMGFSRQEYGVGCHCLLRSCVLLFCNSTVPRQEFWSGLPFPSSGDLPDPGIEPVSPALTGGFFTTEPREKPCT